MTVAKVFAASAAAAYLLGAFITLDLAWLDTVGPWARFFFIGATLWFGCLTMAFLEGGE